LPGCLAEDAQRAAYFVAPCLFPARRGGRQGGLELVHRGQGAILINCPLIGPALPRLCQGVRAGLFASAGIVTAPSVSVCG